MAAFPATDAIVLEFFAGGMRSTNHTGLLAKQRRSILPAEYRQRRGINERNKTFDLLMCPHHQNSSATNDSIHAVDYERPVVTRSVALRDRGS